VSSGIGSGQTLQLQGERGAAAISEGTPGNLFVEVSIAADPVLRRQRPHIRVTIDLDFVDATLGGDFKCAPHLNFCLVPDMMSLQVSRCIASAGFSHVL